MANIQIKGSYPYFLDADGEPLESGYIFIGTAGLTPESNQITVYYDEGLTQPAAQPIRTQGGYMLDQNGSPTAVYTSATDYSLKVADKNNVSIFTVLNLADPAYSEAGSLDGRVTALEAFVDQDVKSGSTPVFGSGTANGNTLIYDSNIEINLNGTGDRNSFIDFHAATLPGDYNARIRRSSGQNAVFEIVQRGTGTMNFESLDGGDFSFNPSQLDNDLVIYGDDPAKNLFFDASLGFIGINDLTPSYALDVTGQGRFTLGLVNTTIDSTNSIDGASIQSGTIPASAISASAEDYGVYIQDPQSAASTTTWNSALFGTRIDVSDPNYNASSFNFRFTACARATPPSSAEGTRQVLFTGSIKKNSGGDPFVTCTSSTETLQAVYNAENKTFAGGMSASGVTVAIMDFDNTAIATGFGTATLERVDSSNELCFRINFEFYTAVTSFYFGAEMSGARKFDGTLLTTSNGTTF